jgi:alkylation response protein AidB-like acyl-CoA dehydrogenase
MNFELSEEQRILQKAVRDFCAREVIPRAAAWDEEERFPWEVIPGLAQMGLFGMLVPSSHGGAGMGMLDYAIAMEEVARADASLGLTLAAHSLLCMDHVLVAGSEEVRRKYLPRLASGKALGAWALTEPDSGSDAGSARTRAVRRERHVPGGGAQVEWVLNGSKSLITQGSVAEVFVVIASTSPEKKQKGLTAFVVDKGTPGLRSGKPIRKMGLRASDTADVYLEDVVVPDEQRLGEVDRGFADTLRILDRGRVGIGAWAVGIGRAAFEAACGYAQQRMQFGRPIAELQAVQHMIADMATELDAARLLVWRAAWQQDRRQRTTRESSIAKYFAARAAVRACDAAVQVHGGYGYTRDFPVERYLRDAKLAEIGEGTNEVQKLIIARAVLQDRTGAG